MREYPTPDSEAPAQIRADRDARRGHNLRRRIANRLMWAGAIAAAALASLPLLLILYYVCSQGLRGLNLSFLTHLPRPVGESGGGMGNAIAGSLLLIGIASLVGLPVGVIGGIYLAEYGNNRFGWAVRFAADVLNGVPSIVIGIFIYTIVVLPMHHFSALAGGLALGVMMIPTALRTTEELVRMVPVSQREAALALGASQFRTVWKVVLPAARGGVVTGLLLAISRIAGETAPLLFTAFGNRYWSADLGQPIASLPVQIFTYAISPYDDWHAQAWTGALVLVLLVLGLNVAARRATRGRAGSLRRM